MDEAFPAKSKVELQTITKFVKNYFVQITVDDPYPKKFEVTGTAASAEVAVKRALQQFRKEFWARRPLNEFRVYVKKI